MKLKRKEKYTTIVMFMCDNTYSAILITKIQSFGTTEMDQKREKIDAKSYAIASTAKRGTDTDRNSMKKDNGKQDNESDETPDLVISDICDKKEGERKTDREMTIFFSMILDTWSAIKYSITDKIETIMKLMIHTDKKHFFCEVCNKLEEGNDVDETSELFD